LGRYRGVRASRRSDVGGVTLTEKRAAIGARYIETAVKGLGRPRESGATLACDIGTYDMRALRETP